MAQLRMLACELPDTDRLKLWHRMSLLATVGAANRPERLNACALLSSVYSR